MTTSDILEKIQNLDDKIRYILFGGGLLIIVFINYFVILSPIGSLSARLAEDSRSVADNLTRVRADIKKLDQYKAELTRIQNEMKSDNLTVRSKEEILMIINDITFAANTHGVKINQIVPKTENEEKLMTNENGTYYSLPILIEAQVGYHNLGKFLNDLERSRIYRKMKELVITSDSQNPLTHSVQMTLKAFIQDAAKGPDKP